MDASGQQLPLARRTFGDPGASAREPLPERLYALRVLRERRRRGLFLVCDSPNTRVNHSPSTRGYNLANLGNLA